MRDARLLLVLDEANSREIQIPLKKLGYQIVDSIANCSIALERIPELLPDLVLIQMQIDGEIDGIRVGSQIYNQFDIPIIYVADMLGQSTLRRSRSTAPFGYLFGLLDEKQILATIEVALTRHGMEKKVRESEQWLHTILSSIGDGVIAVDNAQRIRFMNPVAETLTGRNSVDCIDKPLENILVLFYANSKERITISHAMQYLQNQNQKTGFEALLIDQGGAQIPVELFISPLSEKGDHEGVVLTFRDISERKRALLEISKHAKRTEAMLRAAEKLNARLDLKVVLGMVCEICNNTLNSTATSSFLYNPAQNALISTTITINKEGSGYAIDQRSFASHFKIPVELITNALSQSNPVVAIRDIQDLDIFEIPYFTIIKKLDLRSLAISGMFQNNELIGILVAQIHGVIHEFTQEEMDLLRGLADQASIAVGNAILFEQVLTSRERQQALTRRLVDVQEEERRNLARELHDQIGQMMTGLQFSLSALLPKANGEQRQKIAEIQNLVGGLIAQTREISMNLRPTMLDDTGLILTLIWHFNRYTSQTEIKVNFQHHNLLDKRFQTEIETTVFRIIQEALTNVARHAKTVAVDIMLKLEQEMITVDINDHGQGFDPNNVDTTSHVGLSSMRDRAYSVGGLMEMQTAPGKGTHIHVVIPLSGKVERRQYGRHRATR